MICVLNGADTIDRQLAALARQEADFDWEVVIADNGSTDATAEIIESWVPRFPVELRRVDAGARRGIPYARNTGARHARGELLIYCDADDEVRPGWVAAAEEAMRSATAVNGRNRRLTSPRDPQAAILNPTGLHGIGLQGCNFGVHRSVFFEIGGFNEALPPYGMDDSEFSMRLLHAGHKIVPAPSMEIYFQEAIGGRQVVRKVFRSGMAEVVVWYLYPLAYGRPVRAWPLVQSLLSWPWQVARAALKRRPMPARKAARGLINRAGNLWGYLTLIRTGQVTESLLLSPADGQTTPG